MKPWKTRKAWYQVHKDPCELPSLLEPKGASPLAIECSLSFGSQPGLQNQEQFSFIESQVHEVFRECQLQCAHGCLPKPQSAQKRLHTQNKGMRSKRALCVVKRVSKRGLAEFLDTSLLKAIFSEMSSCAPTLSSKTRT